MPRAKKTSITPRKRPLQARSTQLVADILEAAVRVLSSEGAARFTTIRVAQTAGVSVGSLYQYFPNKQAILFRLQVEEWEKTSALLVSILTDSSCAPAVRLRDAMRAFFRSEHEEAPLRSALDAAAPSFHDAPEAQKQRAHSLRVAGEFVAEAAPRASRRQRQFATDLLLVTMSSLGKQLSESPRSSAELDRFADATAEMLSRYFAELRS